MPLPSNHIATIPTILGKQGSLMQCSVVMLKKLPILFNPDQFPFRSVQCIRIHSLRFAKINLEEAVLILPSHERRAASTWIVAILNQNPVEVHLSHQKI